MMSLRFHYHAWLIAAVVFLIGLQLQGCTTPGPTEQECVIPSTSELVITAPEIIKNTMTSGSEALLSAPVPSQCASEFLVYKWHAQFEDGTAINGALRDPSEAGSKIVFVAPEVVEPRTVSVTADIFKAAHIGKVGTSSAQLTVLPAQEAADVFDVAAKDPDFSLAVQWITEAGLVDRLRTEGPYTVFLPTNDAINRVSSIRSDLVRSNPDLLQQVMLYHVIDGKKMTADIRSGETAKTLQGEDVTLEVVRGNVLIRGANVDAYVSKGDISASNGVIHAIDEVLAPASVTDLFLQRGG